MAEVAPPPSWQPPANYHPLDSALAGITVYAPAAPQPVLPAAVTYNCPRCGAAVKYEVAAGRVACEYCGYLAPSQGERVGFAAGEQEFTLATLATAAQGWGIERRELRCESCGAVLSVTDGAIATTCPFCASSRVNLCAAASDLLRPRFLIPFKVPPESNRQRAVEWLGKGWFHPAELGQSAVIDRFTGIYLPFWTFGARITARWKAEVGHPRQESFYDAGDKTWKTRTVIDWRWEDGQVGMPVNDLLVTGSSRLSRLILERLNPFRLEELAAYSPDFLAGWQAQAYDVPLTSAWEKGKEIMREQAKTACYKDISSPHVRNFSMVADFAEEAWRYILLPVYLAAYRYADKVYQVMVNGQTGVIAGQKPVAWWKIWLAVALLLSPGVILGLVGLPLLLAGGIGVLPLLLGFVLLIVGGILSLGLYRQAVASEAS